MDNSIQRVEDETASCWYKFRRSNQLIVAVNFISMMTGIMVVSVLQPILPDYLDLMYRLNHPNSSSNTSSSTSSTNSTPVIGENNSTYPNKPLIIGSVLGFPPFVEIFFTPVSVVMVKYCGCKSTMIFSCILQLFGCCAIAYASNLYLLFVARFTQAISVILSSVAGFSMITIRFRDDQERSNALATAMNSFPVGILIAYPCGTAIYHYYGIAVPFLIIAGISVAGTFLLFMTKETDLDKEYRNVADDKRTSYLRKLLSNKAVMLSLMLVFYSWFIVFLLGATTPNRMAILLHATSWQIGLVLFVSTLIQVVSSAIIGKLAGRVNRWAVTFAGNLISVIGLVSYPWCTVIYHTIGSETAVRIGWGLVNASMGPMLGRLVQNCHSTAHIYVFALFMSFNLFGAFIGSLLGGWVEGMIGFDSLFWGCGGLTFIVAFVGYFLSLYADRNESSIIHESGALPEFSPLLDSTQSNSRGPLSQSYNVVVG